MPLMHICAYAGCHRPVPIEEKYCPLHKERGKQYEEERMRKSRAICEKRRVAIFGSSASRGYGSRWRKVRERFLMEHPLCVECLKEGRITPATDVDHIVPHKGNPDLFWDYDNLQALCHKCHSRKTAKEDGGFGNPILKFKENK